jgi:hypothetical protein
MPFHAAMKGSVARESSLLDCLRTSKSQLSSLDTLMSDMLRPYDLQLQSSLFPKSLDLIAIREH